MTLLELKLNPLGKRTFLLSKLLYQLTDLFQHEKYAKLNAYADDHQIYSSSLDPLALEECICQEVNAANYWYKNNGMIVNEKKHQALILGKTEHNFSFPVNNSIDIFGMTIDN